MFSLQYPPSLKCMMNKTHKQQRNHRQMIYNKITTVVTNKGFALVMMISFR